MQNGDACFLMRCAWYGYGLKMVSCKNRMFKIITGSPYRYFLKVAINLTLRRDRPKLSLVC